MKKVFKTLGLLVLAALALLLIVAATRPDSFRVERSLSMRASPERLLPLVADLHGFNRWNPYLRKDPGLKQSYSGPASGPGAHYAWESTEVGSGSMTVATVEPRKVTMKLDFTAPFEGHNLAEFTLTPEGEATRVTWAMHGPANYVSKIMGLLFNFDTMIGKDFEDGLRNLKTLAEAR